MFSGHLDQSFTMNPKERKKEPLDPCFSLYGSLCGGCSPSTLAISLIYSESSSLRVSYPCLNLCLCRVHLLFYGLLCLPNSDLRLLVLDGSRSSASVGSCTWPHLLLVSASSASQFGTNHLCVALVSPVCVFDLPCLAQPVVVAGRLRAVHIWSEVLNVLASWMFSATIRALFKVHPSATNSTAATGSGGQLSACPISRPRKLGLNLTFHQEICRSSSHCGSISASVVQDLGILREEPLPAKAIVDPLNRFAIVFNIGVFQLRGFIYSSITILFGLPLSLSLIHI